MDERKIDRCSNCKKPIVWDDAVQAWAITWKDERGNTHSSFACQGQHVPHVGIEEISQTIESIRRTTRVTRDAIRVTRNRVA